MEFLNDITSDDLVTKMDEICGSNLAKFPYKEKASKLNEALDWYFSLAFKADSRWNFDDINQTSPPIDTQDLVSGTNRYKVSDFTAKLLGVLSIEILSPTGKGLTLIPEMFDSLRINTDGFESGRIRGVSGGMMGTRRTSFQELYIDATSGTPTHYLKYGDYIYLRPNPNYAYTAGLLAYFNRPASKFTFTRVTISNATPAVFTATAHGLVENDTIVLNTSDADLPTGLSVNTTYYVIATGLTADAFQVSATLGGSAVATSDAGTGVHSFLKTNKEPGIPPTHHPALARYAGTLYLIDKKLPQKADNASLMQDDKIDILEYFSQRTQDIPSRMIANVEDNH